MVNYEAYRETKAHGDEIFPFTIYPCAIPDLFPEVMTHWHEEMEIIYVKKGSGLITVDSDKRKVTAPCLVFILPGQLHAIHGISGIRFAYENIIFHPRCLLAKNGELFDKEFLTPLFEGKVQISSFVTEDSENFLPLSAPLDACDEMAGVKDEAYPLFVKSQLFLLSYRLLKIYPLGELSEDKRKLFDRVKPVLSYIEEHYGDKIMVADAAARTGFSEAHFMRFFKEIMGMPFVAYLKEYRLSKAESLLRSTDHSVLYIAQETGFSNFSYFIRSFKDKYGVTPLKYREKKAKV